MAKDSSMVNRVKRFTILLVQTTNTSYMGVVVASSVIYATFYQLLFLIIFCVFRQFLSETIWYQRSLSLPQVLKLFWPNQIDAGKQCSMIFCFFFPGRPGGHWHLMDGIS